MTLNVSSATGNLLRANMGILSVRNVIILEQTVKTYMIAIPRLVLCPAPYNRRLFMRLSVFMSV